MSSIQDYYMCPSVPVALGRCQKLGLLTIAREQPYTVATYALQRAVTERIKREEAAAEAEAFQAPEAEQEAKTSDEWLPSGTTESIQAESDHPEREKPSHSGDVEVVSDSESNLATPVTPSKDPASRHLAATDGDGSTDESVSDSADSEPADLMHEDNDNHDCQSSQGSHLDHVTDSEQEAASSTPPTQQPADAKEPTELVHTESAGPDHAAEPSALTEEPSEVRRQGCIPSFGVLQLSPTSFQEH